MVEWKDTKIGNIIIGKPAYGINAPACKYKAGLPHYIRITDIAADGKYSTEDLTYVDSEQSANYYLTDNDIVFARTGASVGKSYLYNSCDGELVFAGFLIKISIDPEKADDRYVYAAVNTEQFRNWVKTSSMRSGQPGINGEQYSSFSFLLPPLPEQHAIAAALSDEDGYIAALERLITKKRNIKKGAMQELLTGKRRLPGFSNEWDLIEIGSLADPSKKFSYVGGPFGSNLKTSDYTENGIQIVQLQNIGDGVFLDDSQVFTSINKADELLCSNIFAGDIILSKMGDPVARACIIPFSKKRMLMCSDGIRLAVNEEKFNKHFVLFSINDYQFRSEAESNGIGSTRKRISLTTLKKMKLLIPQKPEQDQIAFILSSMDSEIDTLTAKLNKLQNIKQGMMQELLTGRIRLIQEDTDNAEN